MRDFSVKVTRTTLIIGKNYPYHWQELPLSLARTTLIIGKNYPYHWQELPLYSFSPQK